MEESSNRTVGRIAKILEAVVACREPQRLVDLVRAVDAPGSSVHLLLQEMHRARLVQMSDDKRYSPGPALVSLALQVVSRERIIDIAAPIMSDLVKKAEEDVYLALPRDDSIVYIHRMRSNGGLRLDIELGKPRMLHATAVGQLYLAIAPPDVRRRLMDSLVWEKATEHTITDRSELESRLEVVTKRGWAMTDREGHTGVVALAAPVYDRDGRFVAALSLSLINFHPPQRRDELVRVLIDSCDALTRQLT